MTNTPNNASQKVWICPKSDQLAQEAHKDFAERDQQDSQDMNVAPEITPASSIILDCSSDFVRESKHTCGALCGACRAQDMLLVFFTTTKEAENRQ